MSEIIGVIGGGHHGKRHAQTAANAGFDVVMCDIKQEYVDRGHANISKSLDRFVKKETITEEQKSEILGRIKTTPALEDLKDCGLVVEPPPRISISKSIFRALDKITASDAILASNTSSIRSPRSPP